MHARKRGPQLVDAVSKEVRMRSAHFVTFIRKFKDAGQTLCVGLRLMRLKPVQPVFDRYVPLCVAISTDFSRWHYSYL
jgi:hypothetical protein